jgi:hypothetical protein
MSILSSDARGRVGAVGPGVRLLTEGKDAIKANVNGAST